MVTTEQAVALHEVAKNKPNYVIEAIVGILIIVLSGCILKWIRRPTTTLRK